MTVAQPKVILLDAGTKVADLPADPTPGTRIHVTSRWSYNEVVVGRLRLIHHQLKQRYGAGLVDPTGVLGVETSTTQTLDVIARRTYTDAVPVGANISGGYQRNSTVRPPKQIINTRAWD